MFKKKEILFAVLLALGLTGAWVSGSMAQVPCPITQVTATLAGNSDRPAVSGNGGFIVFESTSDPLGTNPDGSSEIFLFARSTGLLTQITNTPAGRLSTRAKISAAGTMIAFESNADLVPAPGGPGNADGNTEVFLFNTTTSAFTQVTNTIGGSNDNVSISADGTRIVFESDRDLVPAVGNADANAEIFMFNTTSGTFTQITNTVAGELNNAPSISADGTRVVFSSDADLVPPGNADGNREIFLFNVAAGTFIQVTVTVGGAVTDNPAINANGTRIAFESDRDFVPAPGGPGNADGNIEIFLFDTATVTFTQITNTLAPDSNIEAAINGAGTRITFTSDGDLVAGQNADLNEEIFLFVTTTGVTSQLTNTVLGAVGSSVSAMDASGNLIALQSSGDLVTGGNPELNQEIFMAGCADIAVSPISHDFGLVNNGSVEIMTFNVTNPGLADLLIGTITVTGNAAFTKGTDACSGQTIPVAGACLFQVRFLPTAASLVTGSASIPSNDLDTPILAVPLNGTGTDAQAFNDVLATSPFENHINSLFNNGISTGCTATQFCPGNLVTRGQMSAFIIRADEGEPQTGPATATFTDVPLTHVFFRHIERMAARGITVGIGGGLFGPDNNVTRAEMASFIVRAVDGANATTCLGTVFTDVTAANPHCANIERLRTFTPPVTLGCGTNLYCPNDNIPRDQMAAFIARAFLGIP
jgi:Tol biopolymer transport system component